MEKMLTKHITKLCLGILLVVPLYGNAQETTKIPLATFLSQLERDFNIKFSYVDDTVAGIEVSNILENRSLIAILEQLRQQTGLDIKELNKRYYTIAQKDKVTVCGRVLDNFAKNTVAGATIEVLGTKTSLVTDAEGYFNLANVPRKQSLKIRYLGYLTKYVSVSELLKSQGCKEILLSQYVEQLNEVVIYEYLTRGIKKQPNGSITLNTSKLGALPGVIEPDVLQSIQALPGIKSVNETVSDINVRGGTNDQNLILWNGIKMYQSGHFFGLISAFNPYLTDKVTVFKNGTPTSYGDGVSSVINMETKNEIANGITGGAGINFINADAFAQIPITEKLGFQFSARRSITDILNTPAYSSFTNRIFQDTQIENRAANENIETDETFYFYDFSGKVLYDINENQKIRLSFLSIANDLDFSRTDNEFMETTQSLLDQTNLSAGVQLQSQWSSNFSSLVNAYYTNYNLEAENVFPNPSQQLFQKNTVEETSIKLETQLRVSDRVNWTNGYQYTETGITNTANVTTPAFQSDVKGVIRIHAPFTQFQYNTANDGIIFGLGTRLNFIENRDTFSKLLIEPRLTLNFKLADYWRGSLLGEFKSQTTNQVIDLEQNFLGIEKRRWILSDDNELPITQSKQGSMGVNYARNGFYFGLEGFYKFVTGISTRTQGFQNQNQFNGEIGNYQVYGTEVLLNQKWNNYSAWLSYTYNKNEYMFASLTPMRFPNNLDVRHTVNLSGTYTLENFEFGLGATYRTGIPITRPDELTPINDSEFPPKINFRPSNSSRLPEYIRVDASAKYQYHLNRVAKIDIAMSLLNILDRTNILNSYFRLNDANEIETVENVSLGLTPNASVRISF
ncbi:TonB-dependent receptor plug [Croceitalea dokdonensis DOKDO 023]|uniref:TonB-dependent receptor plug n=1 Tax=Croceitalea dokdonensis DOKDO 023 TaxID=1300341 RepID=A0A0P7AUG5_9FLAO|nr:TonB-dependent receptor [Croceitalea dokdonensis]KPM31458.1 TonB-dependent receptor plug [Croceitalea dokdonensis DOKDO 023]